MDRRRRFVIGIVAWMLGFFMTGYGVWHFQAGHLMVMGYLAASVVVYLFIAFSLRCPHCRMPMLLRPVRCLGIELYTWSLLPPAVCRHCGEPLEDPPGQEPPS